MSFSLSRFCRDVLSLSRCLAMLVTAIFGSFFLTSQVEAQPVPIKTAWLAENEAFPVWYAKQMGWDVEAGIGIEMLRFDTGRALLEGIRAYGWVVAGCGALPATDTPLKDSFSVVAVGNDESAANLVLARPDSALLKVRGANAAYPNVFGNAQTVKNRTVLCPKDTSAHYTLVRWLWVLGLTQKDVNIKFLDPAQAVGAFKGGLGDVLVLWSPWQYELPQDSAVVAARGNDCGAFQPTLVYVNNSLAASHAGEIDAFMKCYLRAVTEVREKAGTQEMVAWYQKFLKEWTGRDISTANAEEDLFLHSYSTLAEQKALFDTTQGESRLYRELENMAGFFGENEPAPERQDLKARVPNLVPDYLFNQSSETR